MYDGDGGHLHRPLVHLGSHDRPAAAAAVNLAAASKSLTLYCTYSCHRKSIGYHSVVGETLRGPDVSRQGYVTEERYVMSCEVVGLLYHHCTLALLYDQTALL